MISNKSLLVSYGKENYIASSSSGVSATSSHTSTGSHSTPGTASAFNMKHFIKSRTSSIGNSKNSSSGNSNKNNPVIVHLSMQQGQHQQIPNSSISGGIGHTNPLMPANLLGATQTVINNDHQIYLNPSELSYPPELPDPARHQFEPPVIPLASSVAPRNSGVVQSNHHPSAAIAPPVNPPPAPPNYGVISTEVTPQSTPIAPKKLNSGSSGGSSACFSNYMPMSECSSQNTNDSGRGTHEQMTLPSANVPDPSHESYFEENLYDRRYRNQIKAKQQKVRKYWKERSSHQRRSRRLGRSLSASSLSTVEHSGRKVQRSKERRTYKVYDGDYLTKPGNANALVSEDDGIGEGGTTGGGTTGGGGRSSLNQHQRSSSKPGVVSRMTRASKHEASEHTDMNDSNYEKDRSSQQFCSCSCEQTLELVARKIEHLKLAILQRLEYSQGTSDRQMEEIDKRVRQHLNSLDKLVKDRISSEKVETVQRMDKRMLQERMAFAEEIRKTEMRVDRSLKDWCDSRYQRVDSRIQGSSDRAHSDSGLSRRHSFGEASSIDTGTESVCKYYRDSGAFECSSTASNSDFGGKTPSDSFPVRTPWNNCNQSAGLTQQQRKESPLASEKINQARNGPLNSTPISKTGPGNNCITPPPVIPSSTGFTVPGRPAIKSESISDILDQHIDNNYTLNQQYGTIRKKNRPRLETSSTNFDENESCFGDNESVSQIPILTLPSENMAKLSSASTANGGGGGNSSSPPGAQHRSHSTSVHHRTSVSLPSQQQQQKAFVASHQSSSGSSNSSPASNVFRKIDSQVADMNEDLRQFNSQYLNRQSGHGGKNSANQRAATLFEDKPNSQPPPVDFERMKRLDSSTGGGVAPKCPSKIPPVVPPRGLEMRGLSTASNPQPSGQNLYGNKVEIEDREALQKRIKELEEVLHRYTKPGPVTKAI